MSNIEIKNEQTSTANHFCSKTVFFYLCTVTDLVETMNQELSVMFSSVHLPAPFEHINCRQIECHACYYYCRSLWICFWVTMMYGLPMKKMHTFFSYHTSQYNVKWSLILEPSTAMAGGRWVAHRRLNQCTQVQSTMIMTLITIKLIYSAVTFCCASLVSDDKFSNAQSGSHELIKRKWSISEHDKKWDYFC